MPIDEPLYDDCIKRPALPPDDPVRPADEAPHVDYLPLGAPQSGNLQEAIPTVLQGNGDGGVAFDRSPRHERPEPGFWAALAWCLAYFGVANISLIAGVVVVLAVQFALSVSSGEMSLKDLIAKNDVETPGESLAPRSSLVFQGAFALSEVGTFVFIVLIIRVMVGKEWPRKLALRRPRPVHLVLALVSVPGFLIVPSEVHAFASRVMPSIHYQENLEKMFGAWSWWYGVLVVGLGPGVCEELWCRGFLGRGLVGRYGPITGVLLTSLFFGALHLDPPHVLATFCMGAALHVVYLSTRSLLLPMLIHFLNNSVAVLATVPEIRRFLDVGEQTPLSGLIGALVLWGTVAWALYNTRAGVAPNGVWQPAFPGVELPPAGAGTLVRPRLGWPTISVVLAGILLFVLGIYWPAIVSSLAP
jgi:membrane protease YdiL (CAAX protease family)